MPAKMQFTSSVSLVRVKGFPDLYVPQCVFREPNV